MNCVFQNEQGFILRFLDGVRRIRDVYEVDMFDGSWSQEKHPTINSTDISKALIYEWMDQHHVPFHTRYIESDHVWRTESEKRNALLKITEEKFGKCWVLVLDADETVKFPNGMVAIDMIPYLEEHDNCGIMNAYAYGGSLKAVLPSIRFIPTCQGIHYHTERAMILHDKDCKVLMDYNPGYVFTGRNTWFFDEMLIVNHWVLRNNSRHETKMHYAFEQEKIPKDLVCRWKRI